MRTRLVAVSFLISACLGCEAPPQGPAPALRCQGNEPFWSLEIRGERGILRTPENSNPGRSFRARWRWNRSVDPAVLDWSGAAEDDANASLRARITEGPCLDTMSDETPPFPYHASVDLPGHANAPGCCRPIEEARATLDEALASRLASLALACVHREYPNKIAHVMDSDEDALPPRMLTPAFYGCFDWHSAVHGHWLLARLARRYPETPFAAEARAALAKSLTPENIAAEVTYVSRKGRETFERPYGVAWLLQLGAELREWDDPQAKQWATTLAPLERAVAGQLSGWLPKLAYPIREGEHAQTAFAFGLILDWARTAGDDAMAALVETKTRDLYLTDRDCPLHYEPSGQDFLSPCIAEADLVRRVLAPEEYATWLEAFLPRVPRDGSGVWLAPGIVTDPTDGKLAHLDGLNLSRAWMLEGVASGLPEGDPRIASLRVAAAIHAESGLESVTGEHYEGGHWLGTFATYLVTERGIGPSQPQRSTARPPR